MSRVLEVSEAGPVAAMRAFLARLMEATGSSLLIAPIVQADGGLMPAPVSGEKPLDRVNPLLPLMHASAVAALCAARVASPGEATVAVLRPCEIRGAVDLGRQGKLDLSGVVLVGVDCLSTYERSYLDLLDACSPQPADRLMDEALRLAQAGQVQAGGILAECELCDRPAADYRAADLLIGLVGVRNRERLLVLADEARVKRWNLEGLTDRPATERETVDREVAVWRLADRRRERAAAILRRQGLSGSGSDALERLRSGCNLCAECMDACPRWSTERLPVERQAFLQCLLLGLQKFAACGECGICQMACTQGIPLAAIRRAFGQQAQDGGSARAEGGLRDPLRWTA